MELLGKDKLVVSDADLLQGIIYLNRNNFQIVLTRHGFQYNKACELQCRGGGIGRRYGLKIRWAQARAGSIPASGTSL